LVYFRHYDSLPFCFLNKKHTTGNYVVWGGEEIFLLLNFTEFPLFWTMDQKWRDHHQYVVLGGTERRSLFYFTCGIFYSCSFQFKTPVDCWQCFPGRVRKKNWFSLLAVSSSVLLMSLKSWCRKIMFSLEVSSPSKKQPRDSEHVLGAVVLRFSFFFYVYEEKPQYLEYDLNHTYVCGKHLK
jgi:hypothetical protein